MTTTLTNIFRTIPLLLIRFYQKFISPHKGFRCASNVLHKNGSCSGIIFNIIKEQPISQWKSNIKNQFNCCKEANLTLKSQCNHQNDKKEQENDNKNKKKKNSTLDCTSDLACCSAETGISNCFRSFKPNTKNCDDCTPDLDCGSCGVDSCI
tara:strand:+ start:24010 stop:24465 length:456 start_codon:yes stop_codon:yes gene_type:complete